MHSVLCGCRSCNPHPHAHQYGAGTSPPRPQVLASLRLDSRVVCARFSPFDDLLLAVATPTSLGQYRMDVEHDTLKQVAAPPVGGRMGLPGAGGGAGPLWGGGAGPGRRLATTVVAVAQGLWATGHLDRLTESRACWEELGLQGR